MINYRAHNGYDTKAASREAATVNDEPSLTIQSEADECDINVIAARFGLTGELPANFKVPTYGDFVGVNDYQSALEAVRGAHEQFHAMPAALRAQFENDPGKLMAYVAQYGDEDLRAMAEMNKQGKKVELPNELPTGDGKAAPPG